MSSSLNSLLQRFELLSNREKLMLLSTAMVIIWSSWDSFLYQPLSDQHKLLASKIAVATSELTTQQTLLTKLEELSSGNQNQEANAELARLRSSISDFKQKISTGSKKFAEPKQMAKTLRDMLKKNARLRLQKLENTPGKAFPKASGHPPLIYRHGLVLTLQGTYFDTLNYLQSLENLPWRINWEMIDYQVRNYPEAETVIRIYMLSFEETWLAV